VDESTLQQQILKNYENTTLYLYINPNPIPIAYPQRRNSVVYQELGLHLD